MDIWIFEFLDFWNLWFFEFQDLFLHLLQKWNLDNNTLIQNPKKWSEILKSILDFFLNFLQWILATFHKSWIFEHEIDFCFSVMFIYSFFYQNKVWSYLFEKKKNLLLDGNFIEVEDRHLFWLKKEIQYFRKGLKKRDVLYVVYI